MSCEQATSGRQYWNASAGACQSCAEAYPGGNRRWDANTRSCVEHCPAEAPENRLGVCEPCAYSYDTNPETPLWDGRKCVPCPAERPNWDHERRACVAPCPPEKPVWTGGEFWTGYATCAGCGAATGGRAPFWDPVEGECVKTCPEAEPAEGSSVCRSCAEADERYPYWDAGS